MAFQLAIDWVLVDDAASQYVMISASPPVSAGIAFPPIESFRHLTTLGMQDHPNTITAEYIAEFGEPSEGQQIWVELVPVHGSSGQRGTPMISSAIVSV